MRVNFRKNTIALNQNEVNFLNRLQDWDEEDANIIRFDTYYDEKNFTDVICEKVLGLKYCGCENDSYVYKIPENFEKGRLNFSFRDVSGYIENRGFFKNVKDYADDVYPIVKEIKG